MKVVCTYHMGLHTWLHSLVLRLSVPDFFSLGFGENSDGGAWEEFNLVVYHCDVTLYRILYHRMRNPSRLVSD